MRRAACALVLLAVAGCGSSEHYSGTDSTPRPIFTPPVTAGPCSEVFAPGKVVSDALQAKGCTETGGGTLLVSVRTCADGSRFAGTADVFGVVGQLAAATGGRNSPAYTQAYNRCTGQAPLAPPPSLRPPPSLPPPPSLGPPPSLPPQPS